MDILPHIEIVTGADPIATVIWMHGLGADGWDFLPVVREMELPAPVRFIFPHATERPVTINNGMVMRAWYDIAMNDIARLPDERGIRESQQEIGRLIARERDRGTPSERIVLAGFSQGGAMALQVGLRHAERLGAIVVLSAYLVLEPSLDTEASSANKLTPIFMAHGTEDPVIPLQLAEAARASLEKRGYRVQWETWPMPHSVCAEEIAALSEFLGGILEPASAGRLTSSSILLP